MNKVCGIADRNVIHEKNKAREGTMPGLVADTCMQSAWESEAGGI